MKDVIIYKIDDNSLNIAKNYILNDELVAFPTETVYGLGANAYSDAAIKAVYAAKGRPLDNPLIVHVHKDFDIEKLVFDSDVAKLLRNAFLPGPLTMVYKSKNAVSPLCSCGLGTLAIRVPSHEGAQRFLRFVDLPIAAPSANVSKHVSPVTAEHVFEDLGKIIPMILDGGRCEGGIESTVLDVTGDIPVILRKGLVTAEMIRSVVGACEYADKESELNKRSPGTRYVHYCPKTETALFDENEIDAAERLYEECASEGKTACVLSSHKNCIALKRSTVRLDIGNDGNEMASRLYHSLREGEKYDILIGIKFTPSDEVSLGVENRFLKAFGKRK